MTYNSRLKPIQAKLDCSPDGYLGDETLTALEDHFQVMPNIDPPHPNDELPSNSTAAKIEVYGQPREGFPLAKCVLPYSLRIDWDRDKSISYLYCHEKVVQRFQAMFKGWLEHFGEDGIRSHGLDLYGGCYNHRSIRGGSAWSDHAFGIAIDIDPSRNGLSTPWRRDRTNSTGWAKMPAEAIEIAEQCCLRNIAASIRKDAMHFSAVDYGKIPS